MDHLKTPSQVNHSIQVPFYGQFYDGLGLEGFPKRRHCDADSWLSRPPHDLDERVSCKGAIAYFEGMMEDMHECVRQKYGREIEYCIKILRMIYDTMCQNARDVRGRDAFIATDLPSRFSKMDDQYDAALLLRLKTWFASWFSTCRIGKAEERFSIMDAIAFLVDLQIRMYHGEEEPNVESCRDVFDTFQDCIKTLHKVAMLAPDNLKIPFDFTHKFVQSMQNVSYKTMTVTHSWYHTDIERSMMIAFCLDSDFDALPGDRYYDGSDPQQDLNWTTDFAVFDAKQRKDRGIVQSTRAALTDQSGYDSNGIKHLKTSYRDFFHRRQVQRTSNTEPSEKKSEEQGTTDVLSSSRTTDAKFSPKPSESPEPSEAETSAFPEFPFRLATQTVDANPEVKVCTQDDQMRSVVDFLSNSSATLPDPKFKDSDAFVKDDYLAFVQAWLFFGTLDEVFKVVGILVNQQDFVRLQDQNEILTTTMLESYIDRWSMRERSALPEASRAKRAGEIRSIIDRQTFLCHAHDHKEIFFKPFSVCLSASVLCLSLWFAWNEIYTPSVSLISSTDQAYRLESKYLRAKFLEAGWCMNKVESISKSWPLTLQYFTLQLGHLSSAKDHGHCYRNRCIANQIDEATYESKHLNSHYCSCTFLLNCTSYCVRSKDQIKLLLESFTSSSMQKDLVERAIATARSSPNMFIDGHWQASSNRVADIVREGSFPLITMVNPSIEPYDVNPGIVKYEPGTAYFAISHVWADGLGNTRRNSLPLCQLITLRARLFRLLEIYWTSPTRPRRMAFWIDTLCIPLTPKVTRKKAIMKMHDVYRQSVATLVLDAGLMQHSCPLDPLEVLVRVQTSDWSRRLWTYQEAALAPRIHFQFQDTCSEEIVELMNQRPHDSERANGGYGIMRRALQITWYPSFSIESRSRSERADLNDRDVQRLLSLYSPKERWQRFYAILKGLQQRSTSREFDQIICIAILLGVDIEAIVAVEEERPLDRMKVLLRKIAVFPAGIVFVVTRRMDGDGFTWAPLSMLREVEHIDRIILTEDTSTLSDKGLHVTFAGLVFPGNSVQILPVADACYYTWVADSAWTEYLKERNSTAVSYEPEIHYAIELELLGHMQQDWTAHQPDTYAILFAEAIMPQARRTAKNETPGALVSILAQENGVYHVVFKCTVRIQCVGKEKTSIPRETAKSQILNHFPLVKWNQEGKVLGDAVYTIFDQQWVIH